MRKLNLLFSLVTMLLLFGGLSNAWSQSVTLTPADDGTAYSYAPDDPVSHASNIFVSKTDTSEQIAYLKFDISNFAHREIEMAEFSTRSDMEDDSTMTAVLTKAGSTDFTRATLTWNNKPGTSGELATVIMDQESNRKIYSNNNTTLQDYINEALARGDQYVAFGIKYKSGAGDAFKWMAGKGDGAWGPELALVFADEYMYLPVEDGTATQSTPDAPVAHASNIFVSKTDTDEQIAFLRFNLAGFAYKTIEAADLSVRADMNDGTSMTVQLTEAGNASFERSTLTWNNKPSTSGELATLILDQESSRKSFNNDGSALIDYINAKLAMGNEDIAFGIKYKSGDGADFKWMGGKGEGYAWGPQLEVTPGNGYMAYSIADGAAIQSLNGAPVAHASNIFVYQNDTDTAIAYVKFDVSEFNGRQVKDVNLVTRSDMNDGTTMTIALFGAGTDFSRSTVTWDNKPSTGNTELATVILDQDSGEKTFAPVGTELADYVNGKLMEGADSIAFAFKFKAGDGADFKWMGGKGDGAWGPKLSMMFADDFSSFASGDGVAFKANPDQNANDVHGSNIFMYQKGADTITYAYVKFDVSALAGKEVKTASFSTRSDMEDGKTMVVQLRPVDDTNWDRASLTWNTMPAASNTVLASVIMDQESNRKVYNENGTNFIDYINSKIIQGAQEVAFRLHAESGDTASLKWCAGVGDGAWGPQLDFTIAGSVDYDTLYTIADAEVNFNNPDDNFGSNSDMGITKDTLETYLKFDISELTDDLVGKASLAVYIAQHNSGAQLANFPVEVYAVDDVAWIEKGAGSITWNTKPAASGSALITANVTWYNSGVDTALTSDAFTHYINEAVMAGKDSVSFVLKGKDDTPDARLWMAGREWKNEARLYVDYVSLPPAQTMPVIDDAYVSQVAGEEDTNFGSEADQHLVNDDDNNNSKWIFMKYDISDAYGEAVSAVLNLYGSVHDQSPNLAELNYEVYASTNKSWEESTITWNTKPAVENDVLLSGSVVQGGKWYSLSTGDFTNYINEQIADGVDSVTLVFKAVEQTPGERGWISGKEWRASYITLNYQPEASAPVFKPVSGTYIPEVEVEIVSATAGATIYYTLDGSEPTDASTEYTGKFILTDTTTVKAIAYATDLNPSIVSTIKYNVKAVDEPVFTPEPVTPFQNSVTVTITAQPEDAVIRYSDDGSAPTTLYDGPIILTTSATIKAQAFSADFTSSSEIVTADYQVVNTIDAAGKGPGGVGYKNLNFTGQPLLSLWLKPETMIGNPTDSIYWEDMSGNMNHAYNSFVEGGTNNSIPNTVESQKAPPVLLTDEVNGYSTFNFGEPGGVNKTLVVPDADELDGGSGLSLFVVMKRNEIIGDFASIIQKRNISGSLGELQSYVLEFNGGGDPNTIQFVLARDLFVRSDSSFLSTDDYVILVANYNSVEGRARFIHNNYVDKMVPYNTPVNATESPVIIGGFQPMNIAEVISYNSELNMAQVKIINNYLAEKFDVELYEGDIFTTTGYHMNAIGIGKTADGKSMHNNSANETLVLSASGTIPDGVFVMAGHNDAGEYYIEKSGTGDLNVDLGFIGIESSEKLMYRADETSEWSDLGITPSVEGDTVTFTVETFPTGYYKAGVVIGVDKQQLNNLFSIYPNPATGITNVKVSGAERGSLIVNILDNTGRVVKSANAVKATQEINIPLSIEDLDGGYYFIKVDVDGASSVKPLMIK